MKKFTWKDGPLTNAIKSGQNVVMADEINCVKYRHCPKCGGYRLVGLAKNTGQRGCQFHVHKLLTAGPKGVGKTRLLKAYAKRHRIPYVEVDMGLPMTFDEALKQCSGRFDERRPRSS